MGSVLLERMRAEGYFARCVEVFSNPTAELVTVYVALDSFLRFVRTGATASSSTTHRRCAGPLSSNSGISPTWTSRSRSLSARWYST